MDLQNPIKEIGRLPYPSFKLGLIWELQEEEEEELNSICFYFGTALFGDTHYLYFAHADKRIG